MNNYSWLEQKLHKFALSSQFMREVTFDFESTSIAPSSKTGDHVFITGLARSGTTILLNALYKSNIFASLSYADMPFVLAPNLWSKISFNKKNLELKERAHGDGIKVSTESPEAFEEVFWQTFAAENNDELGEKFRVYVGNILYKYKKERYLSKNNQNIKRIELINSIFSNSKILVPFREPIQHAYSLLIQHKKFIEDAKNDNFISKYMKWIGHTEFGPNYIPIYNQNLNFPNDLEINHWVEQWYLTYNDCFQSLKNKKNIHFISYEKLCSMKDYWFQIKKLVNIEKPYDFQFKESKKDIPLSIDKVLKEKVMSLYSGLNDLDLL
ncbi:sulfotransferase [Prochlorococcus marinus]|uniref:sulfotransferase n=1 Tax=Prochlorococcus marinus TaxID=1219 RepID=UPI00094DBEDC|nr:sulfotransferase [Prochlorococcus marinus]